MYAYYEVLVKGGKYNLKAFHAGGREFESRRPRH